MEWIQVTVYTTTAGIEPVTGRLYQLNVTGVEIEDESEFLEHMENNRPYWDYIEEELVQRMSGETRVKLYLPDNAQSADTLYMIRASMSDLKAMDENCEYGRLEITLQNMREEDWAENWKQYFKPLTIGEKILICPRWEEVPENNDGRIIFSIEPGMAFGTGTHESTKLCIEAGEKHVHKGDMVLDLGCGSGILSIIALLLGAEHAFAVDIDSNAVDIAYKNADMNGVDKERYTVVSGNVLVDTEVRERIAQDKYNVVFVNIVADVIKALTPMIPSLLTDDGVMIASGIIDERKDDVIETLLANGLQPIEVREENGWVGLVCKAKA